MNSCDLLVSPQLFQTSSSGTSNRPLLDQRVLEAGPPHGFLMFACIKGVLLLELIVLGDAQSMVNQMGEMCSDTTYGALDNQGNGCDWYEDHPAAWGQHPPVFLAQTSTVDNHADLCACRNYHDTLVAGRPRCIAVWCPPLRHLLTRTAPAPTGARGALGAGARAAGGRVVLLCGHPERDGGGVPD